MSGPYREPADVLPEPRARTPLSVIVAIVWVAAVLLAPNVIACVLDGFPFIVSGQRISAWTPMAVTIDVLVAIITFVIAGFRIAHHYTKGGFP